MYRIQDGTVPARYRLSWQPEQGGLLLYAHPDIIAYCDRYPRRPEMVAHCRRDFGVTEYSTDHRSAIGFDRTIVRAGDADGYPRFRFDLDGMSVRSTCARCHGTGKSLFNGVLPCPACHGTPVTDAVNWPKAFALSLSLGGFLSMANYADRDVQANEPQFLALDTVTDHGMHGGSLNGWYSAALVRFLTGHTFQRLEAVEAAMRAVYERLHSGTASLWHNEFRAEVSYEQGWMNIGIPGNACGLHPANGALDGNGYQFACHNVDTPFQQLTLIAGLAALTDLVRRHLGFS